ncbi:MAG: hypothetical protein ABI347_02330 [Nitrososphaera sp.]|jgi:hypothetical protein
MSSATTKRRKSSIIFSKDRIKDYMIITLVSHVIGQVVFLPWNIYVMNFIADQFVKGAIVSLPIAFVWNYAGIKVNLYCSDKVKSALGSMRKKKASY